MDKLVYVALFLNITILPLVAIEYPIRIGTLVPNDAVWPFAARNILPAAELAKAHVESEGILNDTFNLVILNRDSNCSDRLGMKEAINFFIEDKINAFFGPTCDFVAAPVARQVTFWNLPMLSIGAMALDFRDRKNQVYPLLTRVGSTNLHTLAFGLAEIFREVPKRSPHSWHKIKMLYDRKAWSHINPEFCHLATSSIVYSIGDVPNTTIELDYYKLSHGVPTEEDIQSILESEIGNEYAGKGKRTHF